MKALVLEADGRLVYRSDYPVPDAPDDRPTVLVRIAACGVCGSDMPRAFAGKAYRYPLIMGHEFSGVVEAPMAGGRYRAGDRVVVFPLIPHDMQDDPACQTGDYAQATRYDYFGSRRHGGMCEYLRVPEWNLRPVPDRVKLLHAAMTEPAAVALHGVRKLQVNAGEAAAVFGAGPIGNMAAQWLGIRGCSRVFVVDVDAAKLAIAQSMGFVPINAAMCDPVSTILERTGAVGVMRCVEACGLPQTFLQATQVAARFAQVVFMGNIAGEFRINEKDFSNILRRELTIFGTWNSSVTPAGEDDWTTALRFMDRQLQVQPLISDTPSLAQGVDVFDSIHKRRTFHNKVVFRISGDE